MKNEFEKHLKEANEITEKYKENLKSKGLYINRQEYNLQILKILEEYLKQHPDFRFIQVLWALNIIDRDENNLIIDRFYEEPNITLEKIKENLK